MNETSLTGKLKTNDIIKRNKSVTQTLYRRKDFGQFKPQFTNWFIKILMFAILNRFTFIYILMFKNRE